MILLDTHIWIWWIGGLPQLSPKEMQAIDELAGRGELAISMVSAQEVEMLDRKGRVKFDRPLEKWLEQAAAPETIQILPLTLEVILAQRRLPEIKKVDPADRLIAATALHHNLELATHDQKLIASGVVPIWRP